MSLTKRYEVSVAAAQEMYRAVFYADMEASIAAEFDETPLSKDLDCMKQKIKKALEQITGGLAAMKLTEEKIMNCEMCGKVMEHPRWQQKYCSDRCRRASYHQRNLERERLRRKLYSFRRVEHPARESCKCEMCGKVMEHPRWQQKYCGAKCRKKAQWRRCKNGRNANQKCD